MSRSDRRSVVRGEQSVSADGAGSASYAFGSKRSAALATQTTTTRPVTTAPMASLTPQASMGALALVASSTCPVPPAVQSP
jgi:hypothetical protein